MVRRYRPTKRLVARKSATPVVKRADILAIAMRAPKYPPIFVKEYASEDKSRLRPEPDSLWHEGDAVDFDIDSPGELAAYSRTGWPFGGIGKPFFELLRHKTPILLIVGTEEYAYVNDIFNGRSRGLKVELNILHREMKLLGE